MDKRFGPTIVLISVYLERLKEIEEEEKDDLTKY
jgi:hypothetical protein